MHGTGAVLGKPRELRQGSDALLQIGGPQQELRASFSAAAVLELVLRHETQPSALPAPMATATLTATSQTAQLLAGTLPSVNETVELWKTAELWMNQTFPNGVTLASAWEIMPLHSAEAP